MTALFTPVATGRISGDIVDQIKTMIRDGRLGSCKIGNSRRVPMTEIEVFLSSLPGRRIGA